MASLSEVARRCGVSESTVSRALNPLRAHMVNETTRKRVLTVSEQLGFRPNALARGLRGRYSNTIGVIVHDIRDPYFAEGARAVSDAAAAHGFLTMTCSTERDPQIEVTYVKMMLDYKVAGVLFLSGGLEDREYRRELGVCRRAVQEYGGRLIALGPRWDRWPAELPDHKNGALAATEHLLHMGHRRIAYIDGPPGLRTSMERLSGFTEALKSAGVGLDPALLAASDYSQAGGAAALASLLDSGADCTAVFASNDAMAMGCLHELKRRRLRVPTDVSLVGFGDVPIVRWLEPALTTVAVPMAEIGQATVARLIRLLSVPSGRSDSPRVRMHPCRLVVRDTTGPPRRNQLDGSRRTRPTGKPLTQAYPTDKAAR